MIELVKREQLSECLEILKLSYENTAVTFGMTEENCPYRGRTRLPLDMFEKEFDDGHVMYGYMCSNQIVGFLSIKVVAEELIVQDIAVLPAYQSKGYGSELLIFAIETARRLNCKTISLGMVHDNVPLKRFYQKHGFKTVRLINFEKVSYAVGIMELFV